MSYATVMAALTVGRSNADVLQAAYALAQRFDAKVVGVAACRPDEPGRSILQQTFTRGVRHFGLPGGYEGTSMASPHVTGIIALLIATKRLGRHPDPRVVEEHLERTATDLGPPGFDDRYGWGLVSAPAALR